MLGWPAGRHEAMSVEATAPKTRTSTFLVVMVGVCSSRSIPVRPSLSLATAIRIAHDTEVGLLMDVMGQTTFLPLRELCLLDDALLTAMAFPSRQARGRSVPLRVCVCWFFYQFSFWSLRSLLET